MKEKSKASRQTGGNKSANENKDSDESTSKMQPKQDSESDDSGTFDSSIKEGNKNLVEPSESPRPGQQSQKKTSIHENIIKAIQKSSGSPKDIATFATHISPDGQKFSTTERALKGFLPYFFYCASYNSHYRMKRYRIPSHQSAYGRRVLFQEKGWAARS